MTALAFIDLDLARRGDRPAFERLFLKFAPMVHGVLLARVSRADADDLMQDVFVTALERLGNFSGDEKFGAWLATIARNKVIDAWRTRPKLMAVSEPEHDDAALRGSRRMRCSRSSARCPRRIASRWCCDSSKG